METMLLGYFPRTRYLTDLCWKERGLPKNFILGLSLASKSRNEYIYCCTLQKRIKEILLIVKIVGYI